MKMALRQFKQLRYLNLDGVDIRDIDDHLLSAIEQLDNRCLLKIDDYDDIDFSHLSKSIQYYHARMKKRSLECYYSKDKKLYPRLSFKNFPSCYLPYEHIENLTVTSEKPFTNIFFPVFQFNHILNVNSVKRIHVLIDYAELLYLLDYLPNVSTVSLGHWQSDNELANIEHGNSRIRSLEVRLIKRIHVLIDYAELLYLLDYLPNVSTVSLDHWQSDNELANIEHGNSRIRSLEVRLSKQIEFEE
ncbi:unnamed protein product [Rotaria sp. Silwood1]|nr:unnamed protein product [Rotaria sp. Silwood1]